MHRIPPTKGNGALFESVHGPCARPAWPTSTLSVQCTPFRQVAYIPDGQSVSACVSLCQPVRLGSVALLLVALFTALLIVVLFFVALFFTALLTVALVFTALLIVALFLRVAEMFFFLE